MTKKKTVAQSKAKKITKMKKEKIPTKEDFLEKLFKPDMCNVADKEIADLKIGQSFLDYRQRVQNVFLFNVKEKEQADQLYDLTMKALEYGKNYLDAIKEKVMTLDVKTISEIKNFKTFFIMTKPMDMAMYKTHEKIFKFNIVKMLIEEDLCINVFAKLLQSAKAQLDNCLDPKEIADGEL